MHNDVPIGTVKTVYNPKTGRTVKMKRVKPPAAHPNLKWRFIK